MFFRTRRKSFCEGTAGIFDLTVMRFIFVLGSSILRFLSIISENILRSVSRMLLRLGGEYLVTPEEFHHESISSGVQRVGEFFGSVFLSTSMNCRLHTLVESLSSCEGRDSNQASVMVRASSTLSTCPFLITPA